MNKKIFIFLILVVSLLVGLIYRQQSNHSNQSASQSQPHTGSTAKMPVVVTFYPLAEFARQVGGQYVQVTTLVPAGSEPHDFEPSTQDVATLQQAKVYIYNGAGFEGWLSKILPDLQTSGVSAVDSSQGISLLAIDPTMAEGTSSIDPHIWLDPVLAQQQVRTILAAFVKADPQHQTQYQAQAAGYLANLQQLDQEFKTGLANCQQQTIVTSHAAFGYLAKEYHLNVISIAGLSPDEEPSPQRLAQIVQQVTAQHIHYIFFESLVAPTLANTIATETGAKTLVFNPLEGLTAADLAAGKAYISVQQQNLQNLRTALSCQ